MTSRFLASGVIPGRGLLPASPEGLGKNGTGRLCDNLRINAVDGHDGSEDLR
jgi:hypothetical protein